MEVISYTNFKQNLKFFMDKIFSNGIPLCVTRAKGEDVVVLSKSDYESLQETVYLLSSPKNAGRLVRGIKEFEKGIGA